jgi:hypothetical protein
VEHRKLKECLMTEEENQSVIEEVAQPAESEQQQDVRPDEVQATQNRPISDQEYNWSETRRKMQELERKAQEQEQLIYRMQQQQAAPAEDDDLSKLAEDDIITVKQAKSIGQRMAREVAEEVIREREAATADERLRNRFPDFDTVVTKENYELLRTQDPELAQSLHALAQDPYAQAVTAYKLLKRTGIGDMAKNQPQKAKALENSKKPVSVQSVTKSSAIGEVHKFENGLTPELRKQLYKEMQDSIKTG